VVAVSGVDYVVYGNIPVKQPGMRMIIMVLTVEEITTAALRVKVPKKHAKTILGQKTSQVDRSSGFSNATLDVINCNFFQKLKLIPKPQLQ